MTTTDQIQFLKETSVCKYLLVIGTPRLCGEPGFQSLREKQPAAPIHCREILAPEQMLLGMSSLFPSPFFVNSDLPLLALEHHSTLPEAPFPYNSFARNPVHLPNPVAQQVKKARHKAAGLDRPAAVGVGGNLLANDPIMKALKTLLGDDHGSVKLKNKDTLTKQDILDQLDADTLGVPIHDENGDEIYVQVIDVDVAGREGENADQLLARVREALQGHSVVDNRKKHRDEDDQDGGRRHDEDEGVYDDDYL